MTYYARRDPDTGATAVRDFATTPPAAKGWVPLTVPVPPVPTAAQALVDAGIVLTPTGASQQWTLRAKTQAELDADSQASLLASLKLAIGAIQADIDAADVAAPTTAAQAFVDVASLKRRALRTDKALLWLLKQQR